MSAIELLRNEIPEEIFDFTQSEHVFRHYRKPRDVISRLSKEGRVIRVRKGLYTFAEPLRRKPLSAEVLAGLIYGPCIISLDHALSWYGLIPERVFTFTCITTKRSRVFQTPLGRYEFQHVPLSSFSVGFTRQVNGKYGWLMATPLKALADKVWCDGRFRPVSTGDFEAYLFEDLRIDRDRLQNIYDPIKMEKICVAYKARKINWLAGFLQRQHQVMPEIGKTRVDNL